MMSLNMTISTNDVNISKIENELTIVINVNEFSIMNVMIDKSANITNSMMITFLNVLIQLLKFEIAR